MKIILYLTTKVLSSLEVGIYRWDVYRKSRKQSILLSSFGILSSYKSTEIVSGFSKGKLVANKITKVPKKSEIQKHCCNYPNNCIE